MGFIKHYGTEHAASRAHAHHAWLNRLGLPVPALIARGSRALMFQHAPGRHVAPGDLPAAARLLGAAHAAGYQACLRDAHLTEHFRLVGVGWLEPFTTGRISRIRQLLESGSVPDPAFTSDQAAEVLASAADEPATFYKDANPRNFLVTNAGITLVDFDDLTLAPFGYDLAKLLLTTAMTHGSLPEGITDATLAAYNHACGHTCTPKRLREWMEIHHILTSPYLGRNGYTHSWHALRSDDARTIP